MIGYNVATKQTPRGGGVKVSKMMADVALDT